MRTQPPRIESSLKTSNFICYGLLAAFGAAFALLACDPSHNKIVFVSDRNGNDEIYVMNWNGSDQTRLTYNTATDWYPAWSPDGNKIAFARAGPGPAFDFEIYVMNADGSNLIRLTNNTWDDRLPAWSLDGKKIAFTSNRRLYPAYQIFVMNANGTGQTNLHKEGSDPAYSQNTRPSGRSRIAYHNRGPGDGGEIYVMNTDGTGLTPIIQNGRNSNPDWSLDGRIAFTRRPSGGGTGEIYVVMENGSGETNLTNNPAIDEDPAWGTDGSEIAFTRYRGTQGEIYVMGADGSGLTNLTNHPADDRQPDWGFAPRSGDDRPGSFPVEREQ